MIPLLMLCCLVLPSDEVGELMSSARHLEELGQHDIAARRWGQALSAAEGDLLREQEVAEGLASLLADDRHDDRDDGRALAMLAELDPKRVSPFVGAASLGARVLRGAVGRGSLEGLQRASQALIDQGKAKGSGDVADLRAEWAEGMVSLTRFEVAKAVKRLEKAWQGLLKVGALEDGLHVAIELAMRHIERDHADDAQAVLVATVEALAASDDAALWERWKVVADTRLGDASKELRRAAGLSADEQAADDPGDGAGAEPAPAPTRPVDAPPGTAPEPAGEPTAAFQACAARGRAHELIQVKREGTSLVLSSSLEGAWTQAVPIGPGVVAVEHAGVELLLSGPSVALGAVHATEPSRAREATRERPAQYNFVALADGETWRLDSDGELSVR